MRKPLFTIEIEILYQSLPSDQISQLLSSLLNASPPSTVVLPSITRLSANMLTTSASSTFNIGFMYFILDRPLSLTLPQWEGTVNRGMTVYVSIIVQLFSNFPRLPFGATGAFRGTTECGSGPTKGSESPLATEGLGVRGWRGALYLSTFLPSIMKIPFFN